MSIRAAPASSSSRGELVLQPNYFTSSLYVNALRGDFSTLLLRYHEAYTQPGVTQPFALFKTIWLSMGWDWLQFRVFDDRSRHTFLEVTVRLLLEKSVQTEAPFTRTVSLFAAYLFFYTQVKGSAPPLHYIANIPLPVDHLTSLYRLPDSLTSPNYAHLQQYVRYILSRFQKDLVFLVLPKSGLQAMNPSELPREIYAGEGTVLTEGQKRKGRPPRREKGKKARIALEGLDDWVSKQHVQDVAEESDTVAALRTYEAVKKSMLDAIGPEIVESAGQEVLERLKGARELVGSQESVGVSRLEHELTGPGIFKLCK